MAGNVTREEADKDLVAKDFSGVNTQAGRTAIAESEFAWLENVIPIGYANMRAVPYQGNPVATIAAVTINSMAYANVNNVDYSICTTTGGAMYAVNLSSFAVTTIASSGTFTGTVSISQWKNERILIVATNGYWTWDGTVLAGNNTVVAITITAAGTSYTSLPTVTFTGGGGAGAAASVSAMTAISATASAGGSGYAVGDTLTVSGGTNTVVAKFQVATLSGSAVATVTLLQSGSYTVLPANPANTTTGGAGAGCTLTVSWGILSVSISNPGSGYIAAPTVGFSGGGGSGATATASLLLGPTAGTSVATFSGRVWISNNRTVVFSAPNSFSDFTTGNSGGSFIMSDETLHSNINTMVTANNFLYIFGDASINVISDVRLGTGTPAPTLFSNTNISAQIGTNLIMSVFPYQRAIAFATNYGFYSLYGTTTQKISDNLDGIFPLIDFTKPVTGAVSNIYNLLCMSYCFNYKDPAGARPLIAITLNKKWFFASQGSGLTIIGGAFQSATPILLGTDGTNIYKLFSDTASNIATTIRTPLWSLKAPTRMKEAQKAGVEITTGAVTTAVNLSLDSDFGTIPITLASTNVGQWINAVGVTGNWVNNSATQGQWITTGFAIYQGDAEFKGRYLGYTMTSTAPGYTINGFLMQYQLSTPWATRAS